MDQLFIEKCRQKLTESKERIIHQIAEITNKAGLDKDKTQVKWEDIGDKDEDNAMEVADYQDSVSLERDLAANLDKIEKALQKIKLGTYAQCEKCGQQIEEARLTAYPEATTCLACSAK
jgi:DnaK suppressor protein